MKWITSGAAMCCWLLAAACNRPAMQNARRDIHSFSNPEQMRVRHLDLDCEVLFDRKILKGSATLSVDRRVDSGAPPLILDTRNLRIEKVEVSGESGAYSPTKFELGAADPILGAPLTIAMPPAAAKVRIEYSTSPEASALQWLDPAQTAGKKRPFLFTQSQAIHARSWIPLQDTPGVRMSYSARVRTPKDLLVLPPSFPYGGMENPGLTFATPTILAGDKSLVSLVAHELAHSWSGNLVTNATWSDFWLNEGFTVYVERRILEKVYGRPREEMEAVLGRQDLERG